VNTVIRLKKTAALNKSHAGIDARGTPVVVSTGNTWIPKSHSAGIGESPAGNPTLLTPNGASAPTRFTTRALARHPLARDLCGWPRGDC